jgi:futalosine hydrolase
MKILIVAATKFEVTHLLNQLGPIRQADGKTSGRFHNHEIDLVITGVGMAATALFTGKALDESYDLAINMGICGSFTTNLEPGTVVNIYEDQFSELGAEDGENFLSLQELKLEGISKITNNSGVICQPIELLSKVNGITVNTSHGNEKSIEKIYKRLHPVVESMEGAAFMLACENEKIPYVQIRAVSNYVEKRNKDSWNIPLAIENLNNKVIEILNAI